MNDFLQRLKQHKLVQWAIAYVAFAFALVQVLEAFAGSYHWPDAIMHIAFGVLALGFVVVLVLAWYHGERGAQRISGPELLLIALVLAVGGGLLWHYARSPAATGANQTMASTRTARPAGAASTRAIAGQASAPTGSVALAATPSVPTPPVPAKSVAVLPFESLSADKNNAYFADGMQDLILTKLADIGDLKVIARTSTMQYGSHPQNLTLVGQQLGVATILEGSVQKAGKQVLINVQLIDVKTDSHIWAKSYTRTLDNIFGVEGEVAQKVATALNAKLTAQETAAVNRIPTTNPQAYTLYLKAQHEINLVFTAGPGNGGGLAPKARENLRQAIALDPNFAAAYANLAWLEFISRPPGKKPASLMNSAMAHARKALSLQPDSPMALLTIGTWQFYHGKAGPGLQALQRAAQLAPGNGFVATDLTEVYRNMGSWQQADATAHQAVRIDPRNAGNYHTAALMSRALGHYADARLMLERGLALSPDNAHSLWVMGTVLELQGDFAGARAQFAQLPAGPKYQKFSRLAGAWMLSRNCTEAIKAARQIPSPPKNVGTTGQREEMIGRCELALGDQTGGRATLTQARAAVEAVLQQHPDTMQALSDQANLQDHLAFIEAWLGHRDAAMGAIDAAIGFANRRYTEDFKQWGLRPPAGQARIAAGGLYNDKAAILARFGDAKGATAILRSLLQARDQGAGYVISPALLRLDPAWDPIRHDPAFKALLAQYGAKTSRQGTSEQ